MYIGETKHFENLLQRIQQGPSERMDTTDYDLNKSPSIRNQTEEWESQIKASEEKNNDDDEGWYGVNYHITSIVISWR